jgi:hypothetical protein
MTIIANAIVIYNDKVLLVKKRSDSGRQKTFWELPGGLMNGRDISIEHAAIRTVMDDVGIAVLITGRWFSSNYKNMVNIVLAAELCDERDAYQLLPSHDIVSCAWVNRSDVSTFQATPLTKDRISSVLK